jgi:beta-carotene hydroxylase
VILTLCHNEGVSTDRREVLRDERAIAKQYWGGIEPRIMVEFFVSAAAWIAVIILGVNGVMPLWLGLIVNTIVATTFYMPMHEAAHGNIMGRTPGTKIFEDLIGMACSIPLGFSYKAHRASHMRHHAHTNDPLRDPDHFTAGPISGVVTAWLGQVMLITLLPVFALVPPARRFIPKRMQLSMAAGGGRTEGLQQLRFWLLTTVVLVIAFLAGFGWPALLLWYLPSRIQALWLLFIFAWYPHHPANAVGRYVDTRVAVFPGSKLIIRGHDHHAVHHLFPRVPHYRLPALWQDIAEDMVAKGVRSEGSGTAATAPIIW